MTRIIYRDKLGRFAKKENAFKFQKVTKKGKFQKLKKFVPVKIEKFKKFSYLISFDYDKKQRRGHSFHAEYKVISPKKLSDSDVLFIILNADMDFAQVNKASDFKIKGEEIEEVDTEPRTQVMQLRYNHKSGLR